jgi:predicted Ser/Thr protein kinase
MSIHVNINGVNILFYPIKPQQPGCEGRYYADPEQNYFLKTAPKRKIQSEIRALTLLNKYDTHFPKLATYTNEYVVLNYINGQSLTKENTPANLREQVEEILNILATENIVHADILYKQLLIKDGILYLVDFGRSYILQGNKKDVRAFYSAVRQFL